MTVKLVGYDDGTIDALAAASYFVGWKYTAVATGTCSEVRVKISDSCNLKVAVYADSAGAPGARLAKQDTSTACVAGWNTITLEATCSIVSGTAYWLFVNSDGSYVGQDATTGVCRYRAATYSTFTFPDPAGTGFTSSTASIGFLAGWGLLLGAAFQLDAFQVNAFQTAAVIWYLTVVDGIKLTDTLIKTSMKTLSDGLKLTDTLVKSSIKTLTDAFAFTDTLLGYKIFVRAFSDGIALTDILIKTIAKTLSDGIEFTDTLVKSMAKVLSDGIAFKDTLVKTAIKTFIDGIAFTDVVSRYFAKTFSDGIKFTDILLKWRWLLAIRNLALKRLFQPKRELPPK